MKKLAIALYIISTFVVTDAIAMNKQEGIDDVSGLADWAKKTKESNGIIWIDSDDFIGQLPSSKRLDRTYLSIRLPNHDFRYRQLLAGYLNTPFEIDTENQPKGILLPSSTRHTGRIFRSFPDCDEVTGKVASSLGAVRKEIVEIMVREYAQTIKDCTDKFDGIEELD